MTAAQGSLEPADTAGTAVQRDGIEHWISDIRSDLDNDPPGWIAEDAAAASGPADGAPAGGGLAFDAPAFDAPVVDVPVVDAGAPPPVYEHAPVVGRHRAPED